MKKKLISNRHIDLIQKRFDGLHKSTKSQYLKSIGDFLDYYQIEAKELTAVSCEHLLHYKDHLLTLYKPPTVNIKLKAVRKLFKEAASIAHIEDPFLFAPVYVKQQGNKKVSTLDKQEIQRLLDHFNKKHSQLYPLVFLLCFSGLRITEALRLKTTDCICKTINGQKKYYLTIFGKGSKEREVQVSPETIQTIKEYCFKNGRLPAEYIFTYNRSYVSTMIKQAAKKLFSRDDVSAHTLRHSYATQFYTKYPEKIFELSEQLGHASPAITKKMYIKACIDTINTHDLSNLYL